jgi:hypothetical protein
MEELVAAKHRWVIEQVGVFMFEAGGQPAVDLIDAVSQREIKAGRGRQRMIDIRFSQQLLTGRPTTEPERLPGGAVVL